MGSLFAVFGNNDHGDIVSGGNVHGDTLCGGNMHGDIVCGGNVHGDIINRRDFLQIPPHFRHYQYLPVVHFLNVSPLQYM